MSSIKSNMTWQDAPVESAKIFIRRLKTFMNMWIIPRHRCKKTRQANADNGIYTRGILGTDSRIFIRYEVQGRGSLHAHIMLWIHPSDVDNVCMEITSSKPENTLESSLNDAHSPDNVFSRRLHDQAIQKTYAQMLSLIHI